MKERLCYIRNIYIQHGIIYKNIIQPPQITQLTLNFLDWHNLLRSRQGEKYDIAWSNIDDYYLSEGICKHGMDEWDKIIRDAELWYKTEDDRKFLGQDHLSYLFIKIEDEEAPENKDDEIRE